MRRIARTISFCSAALLLALLPGCKSPWIVAVVTNRQSTPVSLVEVSYPGGSFGVQSIAPGASFRYRFHLLGTDQASIDFTDAAHHNHTVKGPQLDQGDSGNLHITIEPGNQVTWSPALTLRH